MDMLGHSPPLLRGLRARRVLLEHSLVHEDSATGIVCSSLQTLSNLRARTSRQLGTEEMLNYLFN